MTHILDKEYWRFPSQSVFTVKLVLKNMIHKYWCSIKKEFIKYMKNSRFILHFVCVLWIVLSSNAILQGQNKPEYFKAFPVSSVDMPEWASLMYAKNPEVAKVVNAYNAYYRKHPFKKNIHTQNYKHWVIHIDGKIDEHGFIQEEEVKKIKKESSNSSKRGPSNWSSMGPFITYSQNSNELDKNHKNIYSVDHSLTNPNLLICGTEAGGVYKSIDKGENWTLITKDLNYVGSHTVVKIHPTNENVFLITSGNRIFRSTDAGITWIEVANTGGSGHEIKFKPDNPNVAFYVGDSGLFHSTDAGISWSNLFTSEKTWDIDFHPGDPDKIYILVSNESEKRSVVYRSDDGGNNWALKINGYYTPSNLSQAQINGGKIAVTPASNNLVYVCLIGQGKDGDNGWIGVYKSTNEGESWTNPDGQDGAPYGSINGTSPWNVAAYSGGYHQGFYNFDFEASRIDPNKIWVGTIRLSESNDGGATFTSIGAANSQRLANIHADIQAISFYNNEIWIATDGGLNHSTDDLQTAVVKHRGIQAGHFWGFNTGWNEDTYVGGKYHDGTTGWYEGYGNGNVHHIGGVEEPSGYVHPIESRKVYFRTHYASPNMSVKTLSKVLGGTTQSHANVPLHPNEHYWTGMSSEVVFDPRYANHMLIGRDNKIYKSVDGGKIFTVLYSFPNTNSKVYDFKISRKNPDVMYCVLNPDGEYWTEDEIWKSTNGGSSWSKQSDIVGVNTRRMFLTLNPLDENELWLALVNAGNGNQVYRTTDGGTSWQNMSSSVLNNDYPRDIFYHGGTSDVYLASDKKVYVYSSGVWQQYSDGLPSIAKSLKLNGFYRDSELRLATAGRGIWKSDIKTSNATPVAQPITYNDKVYCNRDTVLLDCYSMLDHTNASWQWSITPTPTYISSASARNPKVVFGNNGSFDISLTVSNSGGTDTKLITNMIEVDSKCEVDTIPGLALSLTGSSDSYGQADPLNLNSNTVTMSAWVKRTGNQASFSALMFIRGNGTVAGLNLGANNELRYHWDNGQWWWDSGLVLPDNKWTHVVLVVEPTKASIYMDGKVAVHNTNHAIQSFNANMGIGADLTRSDRMFKGEIDEICVWDRALSMDEIRSHRHLTKEDILDDSSLKAYYQFNAAGVNSFFNKAGAQHGSMSNAAVKVNSTAPVGGGVSSKQTITSTGNYIFSMPNVRLDFPVSGTYPNGDVYVSRIHMDPNNLPNNEEHLNYYWVINNYGSNATFSTLEGMNFYPYDANPSSVYANNPSNVYLTKRDDDNEDQNTWTTGCSASEVVAGTNGYYRFDNTCNINSFSQFLIYFMMPLPVDILSFQANLLEDKTVQLEWKVSNETNLKHYIIERSRDGKYYEPILSVSPKNLGLNKEHNYSKIDTRPLKGMNFYRIKSVDYDESFEYSQTRSIYYDNRFDLPKVFPNPLFKNIGFNVDLGIGNQGRMKIYNSEGKLVKDLVLKNKISHIDLGDVLNGVYSYTIVSDVHIINGKLVVH